MIFIVMHMGMSHFAANFNTRIILNDSVICSEMGQAALGCGPGKKQGYSA